MIMLTSSVGFSANMCISIFNKDQNSKTNQVAEKVVEQVAEQGVALEVIGTQHFYETAINFLQTKVTVTSYRSTKALVEQNKLKLDYYLSSGKSSEAINLYRRTFDSVELSYWVIKNDRASLEAIEKASDTKENRKAIKRLKARLKIYEKTFARNYGEYLFVREYLNKKIEEGKSHSTIISETAEGTLKYLSVHKFSHIREDFKSLNIPEHRPEIKDIKELFRGDARFVRMKLFQDFKNEVVTVVKFMLSSEIIIGTIDSIFNKFPSQVAFKLKAFTGLMQSAKLKNRYIPLVVEIESLPQDSEESLKVRLDDLRSKNAIFPNDELLITYARTVDFSDTWHELTVFAEKYARKTKNPVYKNFHKRMVQATQKAAQLQDISILENGSNVDVLFTIVQTGIILKLVGPQVFTSVNDFLQFIVGIPFN